MIDLEKKVLHDYFRAMAESDLTHLTERALQTYLQTQHQLSAERVEVYRHHLAECPDCWETWNRVRWDAARKGRGYRELEEYLEPEFQEYFDSSWALANEWQNLSPQNPDEVAAFYKKTPNYLYNLVIWHDSGDRMDFQPDFERLRTQFGVRSMIDYGCGVGNDGLEQLDRKLDVSFVDFDCPSTHFLQWRLQKRGYPAGLFVDVEKVEVLPPADVLWAIDVLEHMTDPLSVIDRLHPSTRVFVHKSEFGKTDGGRHPFHLNFDEQKLNDHLQAAGFSQVVWPNQRLSVWVRDTQTSSND